MRRILLSICFIASLAACNNAGNKIKTLDSTAIQQELRQIRIDYGKKLIDKSLAYKDSALSKHYSMEQGDIKAKPVLQSYDSLLQLMPSQDTLVLNKYQLQGAIKLLAKHNP